MRRVGMRFAMLVLVSLPLCASAQTPKIEIAPVYSQATAIFGPTCHGGGASVAVNQKSWIGIAAELNGCRSKGTSGGLFGGPTMPWSETTFTYMAGPRVSYRRRLTPFAQALFGGAHFSGNRPGSSTSGNGFSLSAGGGLDLNVSKHVSLRLIQPEYLLNRFDSSSEGQLRIQTGIVFRIGERD
jgi:opacity protein-like surface antigen